MKSVFSMRLSEATVQEIHLELIRRASFDDFDGERVVATLLAHRSLWDAVLMDRLNITGLRKLPAHGLIKLGDMPHNLWNVDTLFILCPNKTRARALARIMKSDRCGGMLQIHDDQQEVDGALGTGRSNSTVTLMNRLPVRKLRHLPDNPFTGCRIRRVFLWSDAHYKHL